MKKFFQIIGMVSLIGFSFFYTNKTALVVREMDTIMIDIEKVKESLKIEPTDAIIKDNTIIPGIAGKIVDVNKSYRNMKRVGNFNESLLEYKTILPNVSMKNSYDKYVISGNPSQKTVSLLFLVNESSQVDAITSILGEKGVKANFFVDGIWFEKNNEKVIELVEKGHIIGNRSYNMDYKNAGFIWMNTIISKIAKQRTNYCYNEVENEEALNICSLQKNYTIRPSILVKNYPMIEIKKSVTNGSIISLPVNDSVIKELPLILDYLQSKDLKIVNLKEHIKE